LGDFAVDHVYVSDADVFPLAYCWRPFGLQLAPIVFGDLAAKNDGNLVRLSDGSIGVKQTFAEIVQRHTATEDEVVAVLDLRKEQAVLAASMLSLFCGKEWREARQPFLAAGHQISRGQRVREFLQAIWG
jgi:hypothetical protein